MQFFELVRYAESIASPHVRVKLLAQMVEKNHGVIEHVEFRAVELDPTVSLGHIAFIKDRTSPYEEEFTVASIRIDQNQNRCWRRFIGCKELMHVFDYENELVNERDRFFTLLNELEAPPMAGDASPMLNSETVAYWMALIALCPWAERQKAIEEIASGSSSFYEVALRLRIPEAYIKALMGPYFERAYTTLVLKPEAETAARQRVRSVNP